MPAIKLPGLKENNVINKTYRRSVINLPRPSLSSVVSVFPRIGNNNNYEALEFKFIPSLTSSILGELAEVTISRTVDDHPNCSVLIYTQQLPDLSPGVKVTLLGIQFVLENITVTQYKTTLNSVYGLNLSLIGIHSPRGTIAPENELDKPIQLPWGTKEITWSDIASKINTNVLITKSKYKKYYEANGVVIITPRAEMESAIALSENPYIIYSHPEILTRGFSGNVLPIPPEDILDTVTEVNINRFAKYENTELELEIPELENPFLNQASVRYEYENCLSQVDMRSPVTTGQVFISNDIVEELKNVGNCFDSGGRTKTTRKITEIDGNPLEIEEETWGYAFNSYRVFDIPPLNSPFYSAVPQPSLPYKDLQPSDAANAWRKVQYTVTKYFYNSDGYLTRSEKKGWRLGRLKQESSSNETTQLYIDAWKEKVRGLGNRTPGSIEKYVKLLREFNSYLFSTMAFTDNPTFPNPDWSGGAPLYFPITEYSTYSLAKFRDYYDDIQIAEDEPEPLFVSQQDSYNQYIEVRDNPQDDPSDPSSPYPPLIAQMEKRDWTVTQIICPKSSGDQKKTPEMFTTTTYNQSVEGEFSKNSLIIGNRTQNLGRPGGHTRLEKKTQSTSSSITLVSGAGKIKYQPISKSSTTKQYRYFLTSTSLVNFSVNRIEVNNDTEDKTASVIKLYPRKETKNLKPRAGTANPLQPDKTPVPTSSVSYNGATTLDAGLLGAKNAIAKEQANAITQTIRLLYFKYAFLEEGQLVKIGNVKWIVGSISYSLRIVDGGLYHCPEGMSVQLRFVPFN